MEEISLVLKDTSSSLLLFWIYTCITISACVRRSVIHFLSAETVLVMSVSLRLGVAHAMICPLWKLNFLCSVVFSVEISAHDSCLPFFCLSLKRLVHQVQQFQASEQKMETEWSCN